MTGIELFATLFGGSGTTLLVWWLNKRGKAVYDLRRDHQRSHQQELYNNLPTFDKRVQTMLEKIAQRTKIDLKIIQYSASFARMPSKFEKDSCGDVTFYMGRLKYDFDCCGEYEIEYFDGVDTIVKIKEVDGSVEIYPKRNLIKYLIAGLNV